MDLYTWGKLLRKWSFTVSATDDFGGVTEQVISVLVNSVDDAALISGDISGSGDEDTFISGKILAYDIDGLFDGTYFSVTSVANSGTVSIDDSTGEWIYTPDDNYYGSDQFTVTVTDDLGGVTEQVISVDVKPVDDIGTIFGDTSGSGEENYSIFRNSTSKDLMD